MEVDDIISYHDVVTAEKASLQKGMNYGVGKNYSVFLMSLPGSQNDGDQLHAHDVGRTDPLLCSRAPLHSGTVTDFLAKTSQFTLIPDFALPYLKHFPSSGAEILGM